MAFNFYANTPDSDLIYFGDDPIVWDRINAERLRRGLPPLSNPRPADDSQGAGAPAGAAPVAASPAAADALRQAEARKEALINQITNVDAIKFANQQTLARKQVELGAIANPAERAAIQNQINELNIVVADQDAKLGPLEKQLAQADQEVNAALASAFPGAQFLPKLPSLPSLPSLADVAVSLPINPGDLLKQIPSSVNIPGLSGGDITGMLASTASAVKAGAAAVGAAVTDAVQFVGKTVSDAAGAVGNTVSNFASSVGVGQYGITPQQLQNQGYLKPNTVDAFMAASGGVDQVSTVLNSPTVWTGKDAVTSAQQFASNTNLQSLTQQNILADGAQQLQNLGATSAASSAKDLAGAVQNAGKFGAETAADWAKGKAPADLVGALNDTAKNAQFAASLAGKVPDLGSITPPVEGAVGTVSRASVDTAVAGLLGNPKIPLPSFGNALAPPKLTLPSLPSVPGLPSLPSVPGLPSLPSVPGLPSLPDVPGLPSIPGAGSLPSVSSIGAAASTGTKDEDLVYTGDDPIVWDRINAERIRRGLPGLAAIGYPRPLG